MANKISGIDGRPVQVGGGAPVSRVRDTTDGRKAETTDLDFEHRRLGYRAHAGRARRADLRHAGGQREPASKPCVARSTKAATTSMPSASPTR